MVLVGLCLENFFPSNFPIMMSVISVSGYLNLNADSLRRRWTMLNGVNITINVSCDQTSLEKVF